jgi:RIO-like serine/threonine protein kinase
MLEIPNDYYLSSLSEVEVDGALLRTEGSDQRQFWVDDDDDDFEIQNTVSHREYFHGYYEGNQFFAKRFLEPNRSNWTVRRSVEYQFQNLLLLQDQSFVPDPLFLTEDTVGMKYVSGDPIKEFLLDNATKYTEVQDIIDQVWEKYKIVDHELSKFDRNYDCSYNNILVSDEHGVIFVDFDYASNPNKFYELIQVLDDIQNQRAKFDKSGTLQYTSERKINKIRRKTSRTHIKYKYSFDKFLDWLFDKGYSSDN